MLYQSSFNVSRSFRKLSFMIDLLRPSKFGPNVDASFCMCSFVRSLIRLDKEGCEQLMLWASGQIDLCGQARNLRTQVRDFWAAGKIIFVQEIKLLAGVVNSGDPMGRDLGRIEWVEMSKRGIEVKIGVWAPRFFDMTVTGIS